MKAGLFDGKEVKNFDIPFNWHSDFGWDVSDGEDATDIVLYSRVAAVYRAMQLNADAIASLPFQLVNEQSGVEFDNSEDWQNKVGFLPKPDSLLRLWRLSLGMTNSAYGFMERTKKEGTLLRYIVPTTITPKVDEKEGLLGFWRQIGASRTLYPIESGVIRHIFRLDVDTELLPSKITEFNALMSSAGILFYADQFVKEFFKRGGVKPTILSIKGTPNPEERTRIEKYWDRFIKGYYRVQGKVFNAETFTATQVGEGVADLKDNAVYKQAIENIAMATGIPLSLLLSNSANFATANAEMKTWFDWSVIPWSKFIAGELNDNLWSGFGLKMVFLPEQVDPDAEEDAIRYSNYTILVNTRTMLNSVSAQMAGLTLPPGIEYEDLDVELEEPEQEGNDEVVEIDEEEDEVNETVTRSLTMEQYKELKDWRDIALRKHKRGELSKLTWTVKDLSEDMGEEIKARLVDAETKEDVEAAFDITGSVEKKEVVTVQDDEAIKSLADALNKIADKQDPVQVTLNSAPITVNTPEQKTTFTPEIKQEPATVVVNVPDQPTPQVAVTNVVEPAEVTVNNDVTVEPAKVVLNPPKTAKVIRDNRGNISGLESK